MLRISVVLLGVLAFSNSCSLAVSQIIENAVSPDGKLAFAFDEDSVRRGDIWLVRLPDRTPVAGPLPTEQFYGSPSYGSSAWNLEARRVAVTQGGRVEASTMVFEYTHNNLLELSLPALSHVPERWFAKAKNFTHCYIRATRWHGENRLEFSVAGTMVFNQGKDDSDYHDYNLKVLVRFDKARTGKIIQIDETPLVFAR